ncbi:MAG: cellulase family glycosylhydrolase [Melioribacteraceae bacterium]|nr:cellulase family glycosylhydrolase [Melioribacteraceae bacterium]
MRFIFALLLSVSIINGQGFLKTNGKKIINGAGTEIILRGIGLGGWMLQEGYMLKTSSFANAQHKLRNKIEQLLGKEKTDDFYSAWLSNHFRKIDADALSDWGFNSVRLPMHYNLFTLPIEDEPVAGENTFLEVGFNMIDELLNWCETNRMYLILDLHAAPGGQGHDEPIADYDPAKPSLWENEFNRSKTVAFWRKIAERYADEEWIGGYDLINEPNWELPGNTMLRELYVNITNAIREVDSNHIIFIEGNWFATDFNGLTPAWDDNMVYSFHKYWNENSLNSINYLLSLRDSENVPLWLGETGENSNVWFKECVELMESNNIGWAWWPQKKIDNVVGPLSAPIDPGYQKLLNYWQGSAPEPGVDEAYSSLMQQAENMKYENCTFQPGVIDALFRQQDSEASKPFKEHNLPGIVFATEYDLGTINTAYKDVDYQNTKGLGAAQWNTGNKFRNDGVDIEECQDIISNGYNVGWIENGEWLKFTLNVDTPGSFEIDVRYAANSSGGKVLLTMDGQNIGGAVDLPVTGGWQNWASLTVGEVELTAGRHELMLRFFGSGYNFNYVEFFATTVGVNDNNNTPSGFLLDQNYPNPFNSQTTVRYNVPESSDVLISLYSYTGEKITNLVNKFMQPGIYSMNINFNNLTSGIYLISMKTEKYNSTIKTVLLN